MGATKTRGATPGKESGLALKDRHSPAKTSTSEAPLSAEQVYHVYAPRVYNMARRMVRSDIDAEDVTQDVLLLVVRKLPTFRGESAFPTWLHRVTVNTALSHRRREAVRLDQIALGSSLEARGEEGPLPGPPRVLGPDAQVLIHETHQLIQRAIDSLPLAYRTVFLLADVEGLPNATIAERLDMSLAAVKSRLHRARRMVRDALAPHFAGNER
jgi:RNA polymerase sigma-70 factor (ECF subfamily)